MLCVKGLEKLVDGFLHSGLLIALHFMYDSVLSMQERNCSLSHTGNSTRSAFYKLV